MIHLRKKEKRWTKNIFVKRKKKKKKKKLESEEKEIWGEIENRDKEKC
jgi:hypothetical protein